MLPLVTLNIASKCTTNYTTEDLFTLTISSYLVASPSFFSLTCSCSSLLLLHTTQLPLNNSWRFRSAPKHMQTYIAPPWITGTHKQSTKNTHSGIHLEILGREINHVSWLSKILCNSFSLCLYFKCVTSLTLMDITDDKFDRSFATATVAVGSTIWSRWLYGCLLCG